MRSPAVLVEVIRVSMEGHGLSSRSGMTIDVECSKAGTVRATKLRPCRQEGLAIYEQRCGSFRYLAEM